MGRAWYMDGSNEDQRLEHHRNPPKFLEMDELRRKTGAEYFPVSEDSYQTDPSDDDSEIDEYLLFCAKKNMKGNKKKHKNLKRPFPRRKTTIYNYQIASLSILPSKIEVVSPEVFRILAHPIEDYLIPSFNKKFLLNLVEYHSLFQTDLETKENAEIKENDKNHENNNSKANTDNKSNIKNKKKPKNKPVRKSKRNDNSKKKESNKNTENNQNKNQNKTKENCKNKIFNKNRENVIIKENTKSKENVRIKPKKKPNSKNNIKLSSHENGFFDDSVAIKMTADFKILSNYSVLSSVISYDKPVFIKRISKRKQKQSKRASDVTVSDKDFIVKASKITPTYSSVI